jgi:hypothetical protein
MKPRDFTNKTWQVEHASVMSSGGLDVMLNGDGTVTLRNISNGHVDCGVSISKSHFNRIVAWLEEGREGGITFGKRADGKHAEEKEYRFIVVKKFVALHIYKNDVHVFLFARLRDWKQIIKWYNTELT